jgi:hypothetical protein
MGCPCREPAHTGVVERVAPAGSSSNGPRSIMHEINQQILNSKYKFKEGAPLKEYLRQRVPNFGEAYTLREVLTMLKEIIRDSLLFDESNPSMIFGDAPLEAALGRREVDVNEIRGVVQRQLMLVEAGPGPLAESMLADSLAMVRGASSNPRSEARAVAAPANIPTGRVVDFPRLPSGSVVTIRPAAGDSSRIIGTVTYVPPQRGNGSAARHNLGLDRTEGGRLPQRRRQRPT